MDYGGEVTAQEAYAAVRDDPRAVVVDVRTDAEWNYVGVPDLAEAAGDLVGQSWQLFPAMSVDGNFATELDAKLRALGRDGEAPLYFLCRSGVRSLAAARAMTAAGYARAYNITHGFEGDPDGSRHRGSTNGWKADGLPWIQG